MFKLMISDDEGKTTSVPLVRDEITIGRKEGNTIRLTDRNVSRRHARLQKQNGHYLLHDLGSYNGIVINGARLNDTCSLKNGDQILIGDYKLAIQEEASAQAHSQGNAPAMHNGADTTLDAAPVAAPPPPAAHPTAPGIPSAVAMHSAQQAAPVPTAPAMGRISAPPVPPAMNASVPLSDNSSESYKQMRLVFLAPAGVPAPVMLDRLPMILGRSEAADIALPFSSISREHARIALHNGELVVEDLGSANGIMVNGVKTPRSPISAGDLVTLGVVEFRVARRGDNTMVMMREAESPSRRSPVPGILAGVLGGGGVIGLLVFFVMRSSVPSAPASTAPTATSVTAPSSVAIAQPDPPIALAPTPQPAAMAPAPAPQAIAAAPPPEPAPVYVAAAEPAPSRPEPRAARSSAPERHSNNREPSNPPTSAPAPAPRQAAPQPTTQPAPTVTPTSNSPRASAPAPATTAAAGAQSPIDEARACLRQSDNACAVNALRGRAATEPELALLATTYRQMGNRPQAEGVMRRYLTRFPAGPRSQSFRDFLDSE